MIERRDFLRALGLSAAGLAASRIATAGSTSTAYVAPVPADTGARGRVVVVGGGMAGATVAKYLRLWGGKPVEVVLIDVASGYVSNIMSNFVLTGTRTLSGLTYTYDKLKTNYGISVIKGMVTEIRPGTKTVMVGTTPVTYDRLVLAPGLDFAKAPGVPDALQGYYPHAWKTGAQTTELRRQLLAMPSTGGTFLMAIPAAPYRCPPGPYERACLIADWLQRNRPQSKVIVLDANPGITAEAHTFTAAFNGPYANTIQYHPNTAIREIIPGVKGGGTVLTDTVYVDANGFEVSLGAGPSFTGNNVISPITRQRAGDVMAGVPGLLNGNGGRFAAVDVLSYQSTALPDIHVIGDAAKTTQPKAGHIANQEAKVCADAITRLMRGQEVDPAPVTNSACYSPINATQASWLTAMFQYDPVSRTMKKYVRPLDASAPGVIAEGEAGAWTSDNFEEMGKWFRQLMADTYA